MTRVKAVKTVWDRGKFAEFQNGPPQKLVGI